MTRLNLLIPRKNKVTVQKSDMRVNNVQVSKMSAVFQIPALSFICEPSHDGLCTDQLPDTSHDRN